MSNASSARHSNCWSAAFALLVAVPLLAAALPAQAADPLPPSSIPAPTNERCLGCHSDAAEDASQPHADLSGSTHADLKCISCHTSAESVRHPRNKLGKVSLPACETCHAQDIAALPLSVHAKLVGETPSPDTCASCHGPAHAARNRALADSLAHPANQAASCGSCHKLARRKFQQSAHAKALQGGDTNAPSCAGCHSAHSVKPVADVTWRLEVSNDACGKCHEARGESFRDNFHGQMAHLQFGGTAVCADCHRAHDILPATDPQSSVAAANLVKTCGTCHEQANANFVKYRPHANPHERTPGAPALHEDTILWGTMLFMKILIIGVFGFFGAHSILWLIRSLLERNRN
jgi:hypothetical protein